MAANNVSKTIYQLFVGGLPWTVSASELKRYFSQFGHVSNAKVIFNRDTGMSKHYGFVDIINKETYESILQKRIHKLGGKTLMIRTANTD